MRRRGDRMAKPKRRRPPRPNDLLYTCPVGMPTRAIATALGASGYWVAEVSPRDWKDPTQDEAAFRHVAPLDTTRRPERVEDELIIIRDSDTAPAALLAKVLDQLLGLGTERHA